VLGVWNRTWSRELELTIGGVHGGHWRGAAETEVAWRAEKKAARRTTVAAGRRATRGIAGKQELARGCSGGEQRRGAARADGRAAWHGGEKTALLGEGGSEAGEDAWKCSERRWGSGGADMAGVERQRRAAEEQRKGRERGRRRRTRLQISERTGTLL
jgi:hypothetical protein